MTRSRDLGVVMLLAALYAVPVNAQTALHPARIDVGVGLGRGGGGGARSARSGPAVSGLLAWHLGKLGKRRASAVLVGVSGGVQTSNPFDQDCTVRAGGGACLPDYPTFYSVAAFAGWQSAPGDPGQGVRALLGPAVVWGTEEQLGVANRRVAAAAFQARADYSIRLAAHASVVLWAQGMVVPRFRGTTFSTTALGIGVGLH